MVSLDVSLWGDWTDCTQLTSNADFTRSRTRTCQNGSTCSHVLSEQETCYFNVWHGETDIADYSVGSQMGSDTTSEWLAGMMFDDPSSMPSGYGGNIEGATIWVTDPCNWDAANCIVTINFKVNTF